MGVNSTHPLYDASLPAWSRARDVLAGEDAVKAAGERYLPRLDSQSDEEYAAYKGRGSFFGATGRTLEEYLDLVFRRAPVMNLADSQALGVFARGCDRFGSGFVGYARGVVNEVLSVGRAGSLVVQDSASGRPWVSVWRAEDILNWTAEWVGGRLVLVSVVLREGARVRVLRLGEVEEIDGSSGTGCVMEVWDQEQKEGDEGDSQSSIADSQGAADPRTEAQWTLMGSESLRRGNVPVRFVPFVFHGPRHSRPDPDRLPLADIIAANLDHYRLDADYKHGLHFAALPTAWVSGFDKAAPLRIGSSTAWVSEVPGASAGFLEFSGVGLGHLEHAMEKVERRMVLLGARMLDAGVSAAGQAGGAAGSGDLCGLGSIVACLNESLSGVLQVAQWWIAGGEMEAQTASIAMNTDLAARVMSGEEITAVVSAWRSGAISRETMLERLKRGEVLPDKRTIAQERELIHGKLRVES